MQSIVDGAFSPEMRARARRPAAEAAKQPGEGVKRVFDVTVVLCALTVLSPLMLLLAAMVRWSSEDGGPVLFKHTRVGRHGMPFECYKFRTMAVDSQARLAAHLAADSAARREWEETFKLKFDPRITRLGHTLRKLSLDELPQLFNVLRGDMSVVGPRPVVAAELRAYGRSARHYRSMRPGLTGLWQVSGRNDVTYRKRVAFDRYYAGNWSVPRDLAIIVRTVPVVCFSRGSY